MTDPEIADRTYIEPVTPEWVAKVIERERPDALLPTMGGQTALNVAMALAAGRHAGEVRRGADRGQRARHPDRGGPRGVRRGDAADRPRDAPGSHGANRGGRRSTRWRRPAIPAILRPVVHPGRHRAAASRTTCDEFEAMLRRGLELSPVQLGAGRAQRHRLEGVRARGDARRRRQRRDRLLHREPRPDGRAHRRLDHRGAGDDADRSRVPGDARRGDPDHPRDRRRGRRLQHPVRGEPRHRRAAGDRDEPARVALLGARVQGDRLPDRAHRHQARGRLPAGRAAQRHHPDHAGVVRAGARLRGGEDPALRLREVPRPPTRRSPRR